MPTVSQTSGTAPLRAVVTSQDPGEGWDVFVAMHPSGHLMQSRAWAAVRKETGWKPFFVTLTEHEDIRAVALCLRYGIPGTSLSLLYIPRGPVLSWESPQTVTAVGDVIRQLGVEQRAFLIQADPAVPDSRLEVHAALEQIGFRRQEKQGVFRISNLDG